MRIPAAVLVALCLSGCARRPVSAPPTAPDPAAPGQSGWVDLTPGMGLRIESAYFKSGAPRNIANYLGTETAEFLVRNRGGLRLQPGAKPLAARPAGQPAAPDLLPGALRGYPRLRFYYAVVFRRQASGSASVLLGANTPAELEKLSARLTADPESVCGPAARNCAAFPVSATVSPQMRIVVNGVPRYVVFGGQLSDVAPAGRRVELLRGTAAPAILDSSDPGVRRMILRAGDRLRWQ